MVSKYIGALREMYPHDFAPQNPTVTETFAPLDQILGQTDALLAERGSTHGDYPTQAAVTQAIKAAMRTGPNWNRLSDAQRDALEMLAVKQGRILCGDPDFQDHWDDLEGYARLGGGRK